MISDLISYALLAFIFVVTGLRMLVKRPNKMTEVPLQPWRKVSQRRRDQ